MTILDAMDRRLIEATQGGLPIVAEPYAAVADEIGVSETEVIDRLKDLIARGVIRRIAAAPNHYALGMVANGMTVWDVEDRLANMLGEKIGALTFVSHCYLRPRTMPEWPYNLFAMVHGGHRQEVEVKRSEIAAILGSYCRACDILYSTRILKKTGLRLARKKG